MKEKLYIPKDSHYATVMAIARRARQLMQEAQNKGVNPWEICLAKTGVHKPIKLAEEEVLQGFVGYKLRAKTPTETSSDNSEETSEAEIDPVETPAEEISDENPQEETQDAKG